MQYERRLEKRVKQYKLIENRAEKDSRADRKRSSMIRREKDRDEKKNRDD